MMTKHGFFNLPISNQKRSIIIIILRTQIIFYLKLYISVLKTMFISGFHVASRHKCKKTNLSSMQKAEESLYVIKTGSRKFRN